MEFKVERLEFRVTPYLCTVLDNIIKRTGCNRADVLRVGISAVANILDGETNDARATLIMDKAVAAVTRAQLDYEESLVKAGKRAWWRKALA